MKLCQQDAFAKALLYAEVPTYYIWTLSIRRGRGEEKKMRYKIIPTSKPVMSLGMSTQHTQTTRNASIEDCFLPP